MEPLLVLGAVVALLTFIFGPGYIARRIREHRAVRVSSRHLPQDGKYIIQVRVHNDGDHDEHVTSVGLRLRRPPRARPGSGQWTTDAVYADETDEPLTARGITKCWDLEVPESWLALPAHMARFRVVADIASHRRSVKGKIEQPRDDVLNVVQHQRRQQATSQLSEPRAQQSGP